MKKIYLISVILIMLFGCNKRYDNISDNEEKVPLKTIEISNDSLGIIHNEGLDYIISRYNSSQQNIDVIFNNINDLQKEFFVSKGYEEEDMSDELKSLVTTGDGINWLNTLVSDGKLDISSNLQDYLINILDYTYNGVNNQFSKNDYYMYLDSLYSNASGILSESDLNLLEGHIVVAKASFDYWFYSDGTPKSIFTNNSRSPINLWQTLGADCIGGIFGGPCGYLGASALDVFYQAVND